MPERTLDISELLCKVAFKPEMVSLKNQKFPYKNILDEIYLNEIKQKKQTLFNAWRVDHH